MNKKWISIFAVLIALLIAEVTFTVVHEHHVVVTRYEHRERIANELVNLDQGCVADSAGAEKIIANEPDSATAASALDVGTRAAACRETINRIVDQIDSLDNRK